MKDLDLKKINGYLELMKPRILSLVIVTTALGYFLGQGGIVAFGRLLYLLLGVAMVCGGAAALNHYLERDADSKMARTRNRPIPTGLIPPTHAFTFGVLLVLFGVIVLYWKVNLLTAFLSLLSAFLYVLVYTPLKKVSWVHTSIGAIPGALPPLGGWAAATGNLSLGGWVLFAILFVWQHPHFYSIAWMFRDDYRIGGFKVLPVVQPDGRSTLNQIILFSLLLIPVSILPFTLGISGKIYLCGAVLLGVALLNRGVVFSISKTHLEARNLLRATVLYLPALLLLILIDTSF